MNSEMNRREFIIASGLGTASMAVSGCTSISLQMRAASGPNEKPNFLFILIDDMGWSDLGCYGNQFHETPNIDRLAEQGMRFTDAYAAAPVCSPTRASILAGQYPARIGITDFIPGHQRPWAKLKVPQNRLQMPAETITIAEVLKEHGYATGHIGKWHLGGAPRDPAKREPKFMPQNQGFDTVVQRGRNLNDKQVTSFTDSAIDFIKANRDKPFFLYLSHHSVHIPLQAPQQLIEKYEKKPKLCRTPYGAATGLNNPIYAAMIEQLDASIGRIINKLDELNLADRTMVVFFSDNGGLYKPYGGYGGDKSAVTTNWPLRDEKGTLYEGGIREPLIVRWPGMVKAAASCGVSVCSIDFYPTFLEIAGAKANLDQVLDGKSILGLLTQIGRFERDAIYWHYPHYHHSTPAGAIRQDNWKLIEFFEDGRIELYNLEDDIAEKNNLAIEMPEKAAQLQQRLAAWRESVGAKMPMPNPDFDPARAHEWGSRQRKKTGPLGAGK